MKELRKLVREIHNGKCSKSVMEKYREKLIHVYTDYAALELTFSAYMLREECQEKEEEREEREDAMLKRLWRILEEFCEENSSCEKLSGELKELRQEITEVMDRFTAYTDQLVCYEYVLNRLELKFLSEEELKQRLSSMDEEQFMGRMLRYIYGDDDPGIVRAKIRMVVGQLPARMTKAKLFEKIGEALSLYKGGERSALDDFLYVLRTSAMVYEPAGSPGDYPGIERGLEQLAEADYANMTKQEYFDMAELLEVETKAVQMITDFYYGLQKVVNTLYALCLLSSYTEERGRVYEMCLEVWRSLLQGEYLDEMLVNLEGEIETRVEASNYLESVLVEREHMDLETEEMKEFLSDMAVAANLLSDSLFVDLDRVREEGVADEAYVKEKEALFEAELSARFKEISKPLRRAVTSQILEKLPVFFQNRQEVEEYIRVNLLGCQDKAEKCTVMELLSDLAAEEQEWYSERMDE